MRKSVLEFYAQKKWGDALKSLEQINYPGPEDERYFANCLHRLGDKEKALEHSKKKLFLVTGRSPEFFIDMANKAMYKEFKKEFESCYVFLGGKENLGAVLHHEGKEVRYITMISMYDLNPYTPEYYKWLISVNPKLENVVLPAVAFSRYKKVSLTAYPFVKEMDGDKAIEKIVEISRTIENCPIRGIDRHYLHYGTNKIPCSYYFSHFGNERMVEKIVDELCAAARKKNSDRSAELFIQLKQMIIRQKLCRLIDDRFFAVSQGSFTSNNVLYCDDCGKEKLWLIDNSHYFVSFKGYDLALYYSTKPVTFMEIKEKVLNRYAEDFSADKFHVWELFFMLMLSYRKVTKKHCTDADGFYSELFSPMFEYFRGILENKR